MINRVGGVEWRSIFTDHQKEAIEVPHTFNPGGRDSGQHSVTPFQRLTVIATELVPSEFLSRDPTKVEFFEAIDFGRNLE